MIFETHAHYDDERFTEDRDQLLSAMPEKGIKRIINVGASIETTKTTLALAEQYDFVYAAVGVHPSDISGLNEETFAWLSAQTKREKTVAVGEIGLDYYWDKEEEVQAKQRLVRKAVRTGEGSFSSGHHPLQRCGSRHHGSDEAAEGERDTGCHPLLFLFQGNGTGIYQNGLLHRSRWCRDL